MNRTSSLYRTYRNGRSSRCQTLDNARGLITIDTCRTYHVFQRRLNDEYRLSYSTRSEAHLHPHLDNSANKALRDTAQKFTSSLDRLRLNKNDIIVDDLAATVAAHKASNRTAAKEILCQRKAGAHLSEPLQGTRSNNSISTNPRAIDPTISYSVKSCRNALGRDTGAATIQGSFLHNASPSIDSHKQDIRPLRKLARTHHALEGVGRSKPSTKNPPTIWQVSDSVPTVDQVGIFWPWLTEKDCSMEISGTERLNIEMAAFEEFMNHTESEHRSLDECIGETIKFVGKTLPGHQVSLSAPYSVGLAFPTDEICFCITHLDDHKHLLDRGPSPGRWQAKKAGHRAMDLLKTALLDSGRAEEVEQMHIGYQQDLVLRDKLTDCRLRFTYGRGNPQREELIRYYLSEYPELRPLFMVIVHALSVRNIVSSRSTDKGPWAWLIIILTVLKHLNTELMGRTLGHKLLRVLKFWSEAKTEGLGYAADPPRKFFKFEKSTTLLEGPPLTDDDVCSRGIVHIARKNWKMHKNTLVHRQTARRPDRLCLQDPANPEVDIGAGLESFGAFQATCADVHIKMLASLDEWDMLEASERQHSTPSLLGPIVGADYRHYILKRERLSGGDYI